MQLTPKTASVVPPEDGRLTPETCRGLRHNKVLSKSVLSWLRYCDTFIIIYQIIGLNILQDPNIDHHCCRSHQAVNNRIVIKRIVPTTGAFGTISYSSELFLLTVRN
jgi:hypothetical protein